MTDEEAERQRIIDLLNQGNHKLCVYNIDDLVELGSKFTQISTLIREMAEIMRKIVKGP